MKKIIFFKIGTFSHINQSVWAEVLRQFPDHEAEICDVFELMEAELTAFPNLLYLLWDYGADFLQRYKSRYDYQTWALGTAYMFGRIRQKIALRYAHQRNGIAFTFQTQSLFDASIEGIPNFIYTDSTVLANQYYSYIHPRRYMKSKAWMQLERETYHRAACVFLFSTDQQRSVQEQYGVPASQTACVLAGPNAPLTPGLPYGSAYSARNILFVGVNWERKGGPQLYEAFRLIRASTGARLTIVGCSPSLPDMEGVEIMGRVERGIVDQAFAQASIFCLPTLQEPFGIVFVEAMHRKVPIISHRIGALPDLVQDGVNGFLLQPFDIPGLARQLELLLLNPELCRNMGQTAFQMAQAYTWEKTVTRMKQEIENRCRT